MRCARSRLLHFDNSIVDPGCREPDRADGVGLVGVFSFCGVVAGGGQENVAAGSRCPEILCIPPAWRLRLPARKGPGCVPLVIAAEQYLQLIRSPG